MKTRKNKKGGDTFSKAMYEFRDDGTHRHSVMRVSKVREYMKTIKMCNKKERDPTSLSFLISSRSISQSACIRLGNVIEDILNIYLEYHLNNFFKRKNIVKNKKGERQKDLFFVDEESKHIIYGELKANINLDTQKSKSTSESIQQLVRKFDEDGYSHQAYLISLRYLRTADIPGNLAKRYKDVRLIGLTDFIEDILKTDPPSEFQSYENYSSFLTTLVDAIECE